MLDVACGIIERDGLVLAARRKQGIKHGGRWEFPGGKLHPEETAEQALLREIEEELSIRIKIIQRLPEVVHAYVNGPVRLFPMICQWEAGEPTYTDHDKLVWLPVEDLAELDWLEADLPVLDTYLRRR